METTFFSGYELIWADGKILNQHLIVSFSLHFFHRHDIIFAAEIAKDLLSLL